MRIRVIGVGTPCGDDAAGLLVARSLAADGGLPAGVDAVTCSRPLDLVDALDGVDACVVLDATRSGRPPGTVHEPAFDDLCEARPFSSHGLGVREALAVAEALGRAPQRLAIIGIEAASTTGDGVSEPVRAALEEAAERARGRCVAWKARTQRTSATSNRSRWRRPSRRCEPRP